MSSKNREMEGTVHKLPAETSEITGTRASLKEAGCANNRARNNPSREDLLPEAAEPKAEMDPFPATDYEVEELRRFTSWSITAPIHAFVTSIPFLRRVLFHAEHLAALLRHSLRTYGWVVTLTKIARALDRHLSRRLFSSARERVNIAQYLPQTGMQMAPPRDVAVDVIVPVYRGLEETKRCLHSLLSDVDRFPGTIRVIDDCSPDKELSGWLSGFASDGRIELSRNRTNLGFVATVNRGIIDAGRNDVVLLNSDTEVPAGWLRRLVAHAYSRSRTGSVTPFSNYATICSYPSTNGGPLPQGYSLALVDDAFRTANNARHVEVPTGVGFCMFIRRACLDEVGLFDEQRFGRGYGEENDFCMRALARGWHHLLAGDTFVYHKGGVSFGNDSPELKRAWDILANRHPKYPALVARHVASAVTVPMIFSATVALFRASRLPTILMVSHDRGGGTARHIEALIGLLIGSANVLLLRPNGGDLEVHVASISDHPTLTFPSNALDDLITFLQACRINRAHVHNWLGFGFDLREFIDRLGVPFDLTVHDYSAICPRINLLSERYAAYCNEPAPDGCNICIQHRAGSTHGATDITSWRTRHKWLLSESQRVICPSHDVQKRLSRYVSSANLTVVPHEAIESDTWNIVTPTLDADEPLRIAVLGVPATPKGRRAFEACVEATDTNSRRFILIGHTDTRFAQRFAGKVHVTEAYEDYDLTGLLNTLSPHVIWVPQSWPEPYSYALSAAIESGLPIAASGLGAVRERLAGRPQTWIIDHPAPAADDWLTVFDAIAASLRSESKMPRAPRPLVPRFYPESYLAFETSDQTPPVGPLTDLREPGVQSILMLPDRDPDGRISPCGHIRLLQPLDHLCEAYGTMRLHEVDVRAALNRVADILVCQRHVTQDIETAERIISHCRDAGMRLVYDLDDDLVSDAPGHPERALIQSLSPVVVRFLLAADAVWAATPELASRLRRNRSDVVVIPNYLDERLWVTRDHDRRRQDDNVTRLLYMGTATHDAEYQFLRSVAQRVLRRVGKRVSFDILGVTERAYLHRGFHRIEPPRSARSSYPAFVAWIRRQSCWDIGLAPLIDTHFSLAKSDIKMRDYAGLGLPVIASDVPPYRAAPELNSGVRLVENDPGAWEDALIELIEDPQTRRDQGRRCRSAFLTHYSLAVGQRVWLDALRAVSHLPPDTRTRHVDFREVNRSEPLRPDRGTSGCYNPQAGASS